MYECRKGKKDGDSNSSAEESLFQPSTCVETGAEVVSPKGASQGCSRPLQQDADHKEYREDDLHIWQHRREFHGGIVSNCGSVVKRRTFGAQHCFDSKVGKYCNLTYGSTDNSVGAKDDEQGADHPAERMAHGAGR